MILDLGTEETSELISLKSVIRDSFLKAALSISGFKGNRINRYCQIEDVFIKGFEGKTPDEALHWHIIRDAIRYRGVKK